MQTEDIDLSIRALSQGHSIQMIPHAQSLEMCPVGLHARSTGYLLLTTYYLLLTTYYLLLTTYYLLLTTYYLLLTTDY
jgi:hypothetical protein